MALLFARRMDVDWGALDEPLREEFGDAVVDEALARLKLGDAWEFGRKIGIRVRREFGDNRRKSGAHSYWPRGNGFNKRFVCMCRRKIGRQGACGHAMAALLYRWSLEKRDAA